MAINCAMSPTVRDERLLGGHCVRRGQKPMRSGEVGHALPAGGPA